MNNKTPQLFKYIVLGLGVIVCACIVLWFQGYRWNHTESCPKGIWKLSKNFNPAIDRGKYVLIQPPNTDIFELAKRRHYLNFGIYSHNIQPLLKQVAGLAGDRIQISKEGISINGHKIPNSMPMTLDSKGRVLDWATDTILEVGQAWVMSDYSSRSFDSRYFGPIPMVNILGVMQPIWTWE